MSAYISRTSLTTRSLSRTSNIKPWVSFRFASTTKSSGSSQSKPDDKKSTTDAHVEKELKKKKTMAQLDEEMRMAMEGHAGDGGEAGLELEGGKAVSMKRGVRENMFRYI